MGSHLPTECKHTLGVCLVCGPKTDTARRLRGEGQEMLPDLPGQHSIPSRDRWSPTGGCCLSLGVGQVRCLSQSVCDVHREAYGTLGGCHRRLFPSLPWRCVFLCVPTLESASLRFLPAPEHATSLSCPRLLTSPAWPGKGSVST